MTDGEIASVARRHAELLKPGHDPQVRARLLSALVTKICDRAKLTPPAEAGARTAEPG